MLKKELTGYIIFHLNAFCEQYGFKLKKTKEIIYFRKISESGFEDIGISSTSYHDVHYLTFGYGKRIHVIENIVFELQKFFEPNLFLITKDNATYYLNIQKGSNLCDLEKKEIRNEEDVQRVTNIIMECTEKNALNTFAYLDNIINVDEEINGLNIWLNDTDKPFSLHRFDVYRIVIAKLAKSPGDYKVFTEKLMTIEEKRIDEIRRSDEKYKDLKNWFVPKVLTHLEEIMM